MPSLSSEQRNIILSLSAIVVLLAVFAMSFLLISKTQPPSMTNRAQSQIRTPDEEAAANAGWNPNKPLAGYGQMPAPNSWAENFGKTLANTTGVDADEHLYPPGMAPAPGSVIPGSGEDDVIVEDENGTITTGKVDTGVADGSPKLPPKYQDNASPVGDLLNR